MVENKRTGSSVIIAIALMIVFLSFIQREKEKNIHKRILSSFVISPATISNAQAIIAPATSAPEISFYEIYPNNGKFTFPDCTSGREISISKQVCSYISSYELKFFNKKHIIGLAFLQKVPEQEQGDDPLPIS